MELASIFLLLLVFLLVAIFVAQPFMERVPGKRAVNQTLSALMAERDRVLTALQELDFDNTLGKIPAEVYPSQREVLMNRGADILRQLDALQSEAKNSSLDCFPARDSSDEELEDLIAQRRFIHKDKTGGFCPQCGTPVLITDQYCPNCGQTLSKK